MFYTHCIHTVSETSESYWSHFVFWFVFYIDLSIGHKICYTAKHNFLHISIHWLLRHYATMKSKQPIFSPFLFTRVSRNSIPQPTNQYRSYFWEIERRHSITKSTNYVTRNEESHTHTNTRTTSLSLAQNTHHSNINHIKQLSTLVRRVLFQYNGYWSAVRHEIGEVLPRQIPLWRPINQGALWLHEDHLHHTFFRQHLRPLKKKKFMIIWL